MGNSSAGSISISLEAESARFSRGVQDATRDLGVMKQQLESIKRQGGSDLLAGIREKLGRRSALGELNEIANGGGRVVGGLTGAADTVRRAAEEAAKLKREWDEGKLSAVQLVQHIADGIPIVGQFAQAGRAIREWFTGEQAALDAAKEHATVLDTVLKSQQESVKRLADEAREYAAAMAEAESAGKSYLLSLDRSTAGRHAEIDERSAARMKSDSDRIFAEYQDKIDKAKASAQTAIDAADKARREAQEKASALGGGAYQEGGKLKAEREAAAAQKEADRLAQIASNAKKVQEDEVKKLELDRLGQVAAAHKKAGADALKEHDQVSRAEAEHNKTAAAEAKKTLRDTQAEAEAQRIKNAGGFDAQLKSEQVTLRAHLQDRIDQIKADAEKAKEAYRAGDPNLSRIDSEAKAQIEAEKSLEQQKERAAELENERQAIERKSAAQKAAAEAEQQNWDQARSLIEAAKTPLDQYKDKLAEIAQLARGGYLSKDEADLLSGKAAKDLISESGLGGPVQHAAAQVRRFDFNVAPDDPKTDILHDLVAKQDEATKAAKESAGYLKNVDRYLRNADNDRQGASDYGL